MKDYRGTQIIGDIAHPEVLGNLSSSTLLFETGSLFSNPDLKHYLEAVKIVYGDIFEVCRIYATEI